MEDFVIGIDLGGTNFRLAVVNPQGIIADRMHCPVESGRGKEVILEDLISSIQTLVKSQIPNQGHLLAAGLGVPGLIRSEEGIVTESPNLQGWINFDIRTPTEAALGVPLAIENDANCFAIGEFWRGAAQDANHACALTLGTGVGGGIILNGQIWRGTDGMAGEVGHMVIETDGLPCKCGSRGCLEQYASATAIRQFAVEALMSNGETLLKRWQDNLEELTAEDVFEAAREGDKVAQDLFRKMGYFLGIGLTNLVNLLNVEMIVLGGKVSSAWEFFIPETEKTVRERAFKVPAQRVQIVKSILGDNGGITGAAYLALKRARSI
ncbi:MAG: ROK family protein [Proteobacteria bacterium]|nr:ROK family protein [Pseudomonadota bacterium]NIS68243.1 ROK family protein [Pseudomonadota bacterium]